MTTTEPPDVAARRAILAHLDETLFVEAGAGSGKTTALVGRVVALVAAGAELASIAAITFTEAAAAELRHRIRAELQAAAAAPDRPAVERERCGHGVHEVDHAAISTLHAFAQRILAEHPIEAGLPPVVDVLDEVQSVLAADRRWQGFLDGLHAPRSAHEELVTRQLVLGLRDDRLRHLASVFGDNYDRLEGVRWPEVALAPVDVEAVLLPLREALALGAQCTDGADKLLVHLQEKVGPVVRLLEAAVTDDDRLEVLVGAPKLSARLGQKGNWGAVGVEEVRELLAQAEQARTDQTDAATAACLTHLAGLVAAHTLAAADERRRDGRLEFHDLLVLARRLLRTDADVRSVLHDRYRFLLLDEFQDTDPLQVELAVLIAAEPDADVDRPWSEIPVEAGRLFFVGDPKQSIYRFRRADIALFMDARACFAAEPTVLAANFRSAPGVIDFVNGLFADLMDGATDESGRAAQPEFQALLAARPEPDDPVGRSDGAGGPSVWLCGGPVEGVAAPALRELEAASVAAAVRRVLDQGLTVRDGDRWRRARPDDIAILLPGRTSLPQLEDALVAADIPYRLETGSLVWASQEVRELLAILRAVDDPSDEIALVAALRSSAFGCGDDDLVRFRQAGGRWRIGWRPPAAPTGALPIDDGGAAAAPAPIAADDPVVTALGALDDLHRRRWWTDVAGMVEAVVRDRRLLELAVADRRPRDTWQRLRYVLDQARTFTESAGGTLRDFLAWADLLASDAASVAAKVLPEPDDRAVRILTIHGAKGLEFPVTVLSGCTTQLGRARPGVRVSWRDGGAPPEVRLASGQQTDAFDTAVALEDQLDVHERLRLLYVALTRACDHLVIATHHHPKRDSYAAQVWRWAEERTDLWGPGDLSAAEAPPGSVPSSDAVSPDAASPDAGAGAPSWLDLDRDAWLARRAADLTAQRPAALAATAIARAAADARAAAGDDDAGTIPEDEPDEGIDPNRPPWAKGRGGTAFGRAVHAALQTVDLVNGHDIAATARAQAAAEGVAAQADAVEQRVRSALDAPVVRQAAAGEHWRELYVAAPVGDTLVEGFVDLLVRTPEGLVVVDYKTDAVAGPAQIDSAVARYRLQGATYALALERHLGEPVARCVFLFLTERGAVEREVADLRAAITEVEQVVVG